MADDFDKPRLSRATAQPSSRPSGDPLAELARLIGRDEVFQQMRQGTPPKPTASVRAPWLARRDPRDDVRDDLDEPQHQADEAPRAEPSRVGNPLERRATPLATPTLPRSPAFVASAETRPEAPARRSETFESRSEATANRSEPPAMRSEPAAAKPAFDDYDHDPEPRGYDTGAHDTGAYDTATAHHGPAHDSAAGVAPQQHEYYAAHDGYEHTAHYDDHEAYAEDMPPPARRRVGAWAVAAVLGVAVIGTAGAVGYRSMGAKSESQVPVIKADTAPAKLVPPAPARDPQTRSLSLDGARGAERLVSNEEQPVDLDARLAAARANASALTTGAIGPSGSSPSAMALASNSASGPTSESGGPKKVRTISIRPDGTPAADTGMRASSGDAAARVPPRLTAPQQQVAPAADPARATRSASLGSGASAPTAPAVPVGGPMVQLASQKTEPDAQSAYRALQAKYPNILSGRQATIKRVEIADKGTFYRAQVGPFASADQASDFCNSLKAVGGQCIVQRN